MADQKYALLVDYTFFSGNHAAEIACKEELVEVGPFKVGEGNDGDDWEWIYLPIPTCIFSQHWGTGGDKAGQRPLAVQVEESHSMYYGTLDEMIAKMKEFDRPMCLFQL